MASAAEGLTSELTPDDITKRNNIAGVVVLGSFVTLPRGHPYNLGGSTW